MEPAYTTIQPGNLYNVGDDLALDYNSSVSSDLVKRFAGGISRGMQGFGAALRPTALHPLHPVSRGNPHPPAKADSLSHYPHGYLPGYSAARPGGYLPGYDHMGMHGFGGFGAVDVRPYVTFYTSAGAVPIAIDPTTVLSGNAVFPIIGAIPYDIDIISWQFILHFPGVGDVPIPLYGGSGGQGSGTVALPGLGDVPYEVSIGPPAAALNPSAVFSMSNLFGSLGNTLPLLAIAGVAAYFLLRRSRR